MPATLALLLLAPDLVIITGQYYWPRTSLLLLANITGQYYWPQLRPSLMLEQVHHLLEQVRPSLMLEQVHHLLEQVHHLLEQVLVQVRGPLML